MRSRWAAPTTSSACACPSAAGAAGPGRDRVRIEAELGEERSERFPPRSFAPRISLRLHLTEEVDGVGIRGAPAHGIEFGAHAVAAGFLAGEARGLGLEPSLRLGAICAAEVIQHYGARPEADLRALTEDLLD